MSEPDPSLPPVPPPPATGISDRAALEAALAGAAGLLLGRVLLGRGAGLLAGSVAIAARLLTDAAAKKPAGEAPVSAPPPPTPQAPAAKAPEIVPVPPEEPVLSPDGGKQESIDPVAAEPAPAPVVPEIESHFSPASSFSSFAGLAAVTADPPPEESGASLSEAKSPFANLFTETLPAAEPEIEATIPSPQLPAPAWDNAAAPEPLPAFPVLTEIPAPETTPVVLPETPLPAPEPILPSFPEIALPHPEEIWKMAAAESAPVPVPETVEETVPADDLPTVPPVPSVASETFDSSTTLLPAFPSGITFHQPADIKPLPEPEPVPAAAPAEPLTVLEEPKPAPTPEADSVPLPAPEPITLPVISLTTGRYILSPAAVPTAAGTLPATLLPPAAAEPDAAKPLKAPVSGGVDEPTTPPVPAPSGTGRVWFILLLIAAAITWLYRSEMKRVEESRRNLPAATQSANLPTPAPAPAPVKVPPVTPPASTPPVPPMPVPPAPKPAPPVPEIKSPMPPAPTPAGARTTPEPTGAAVYAEPPVGVPQEFPPNSVEGKARQTLEKLLTAQSLPEITPLVHDPASAQKLVSRWFPSGSLKPEPWKRIIFDSTSQMPRSALKASLFRVVTDGVPLGFPVAVEETRQGPRIDFNAFVQCRDRLLDAYVAQPGPGPQAFLVTLRRGHYFGDDLTPSELEQLICFEISSPNPGSPKHRVFIQRGSEIGRTAARRFVWDKSYTPVVELTPQGKHLEITAIVRDVWLQPTP